MNEKSTNIEGVPLMGTCSTCRKDFPVDEMEHHDDGGPPWYYCRDCVEWEREEEKRLTMTGKLRDGASCEGPPTEGVMERINQLLEMPSLPKKEMEDLLILILCIQDRFPNIRITAKPKPPDTHPQ